MFGVWGGGSVLGRQLERGKGKGKKIEWLLEIRSTVGLLIDALSGYPVDLSVSSLGRSEPGEFI
jgi:hypothetical protein